jgi:hypothetical protein
MQLILFGIPFAKEMAMARDLWFPVFIPESMRGLPPACGYSTLPTTQPSNSSGGPGTISDTARPEALERPKATSSRRKRNRERKESLK